MTRDPALYAELAGFLRERRTPAVSLLPGQRIPARAAVVLTSPSEVSLIRHPKVLAVPEEIDRTALRAAVESALAADTDQAELIVGIDPGPRPGYAILSGDRVLAQGSLDSPEESARLGANLHRRFPLRSLRFRVGHGDPTSRNRILNALESLHRTVEVVNEEGTTPRGRRRPRDGLSAKLIARSPGRPVRGPLKLEITGGEVRNLQRLSREGSGGRFTIPAKVAEGVLRGELTLGEALADGARRYRPIPAPPRGRHEPS